MIDVKAVVHTTIQVGNKNLKNMVQKKDPTKLKCGNCGKPTAPVDEMTVPEVPEKIFCSELCIDDFQGKLPPPEKTKAIKVKEVAPKKKETALVVPTGISPANISPKDMAEQMKVELQKRKLVKEIMYNHGYNFYNICSNIFYLFTRVPNSGGKRV